MMSAPTPPRLYGIADVDALGQERVPAAVKAMSESGIEWIQIRVKPCSGGEPTVGLELLRQVRRRVEKPLIAIGGIDETNLESVIRAGADSVAILGGLCRGNVGSNSRRLSKVAKEVP